MSGFLCLLWMRTMEIYKIHAAIIYNCRAERGGKSFISDVNNETTLRTFENLENMHKTSEFFIRRHHLQNTLLMLTLGYTS